MGAVAEGLGIRAVARVFAVDPNTVLHWLTEVADQTAAFSRYFLHDVRVTQVQLDELFALLSARKAGAVSEEAALNGLSRSPHWVWVALDPVTKLLLAIEGGARTLAVAQCLVHQVAQVLASNSHFDLSARVSRESYFEPVEHKIEQMRPTRKTDIAGESAQIIKEGFAGHQGLPQEAILGIQQVQQGV
jgi:hypothetical protein